jgi:hypothetical protein
MSYPIIAQFAPRTTIFESRDWMVGLTITMRKVVVQFDELLTKNQGEDVEVVLSDDEMTIFQNLIHRFINIDDAYIQVKESSLISYLEYKYTYDEEDIEVVSFQNKFDNKIIVRHAQFLEPYQD